MNATITLKNSIDLTNKCGTYLSFNMKLNTVIEHDWFYIEASRDGTHWDTIAYLSGTGTDFSTYSLTNYDNSPYLKIRFGLTTDGKAGPSSICIDNVKISAFDPSSTQENYVFCAGTSMATPYVSGLAGLIKAMNPSLTALQIRDAILQNVDDKSSLSGKILTEGRINASKTLSSIVSLPLSATTANAVPIHTRYLSASGHE